MQAGTLDPKPPPVGQEPGHVGTKSTTVWGLRKDHSGWASAGARSKALPWG